MPISNTVGPYNRQRTLNGYFVINDSSGKDLVTVSNEGTLHVNSDATIAKTLTFGGGEPCLMSTNWGVGGGSNIFIGRSEEGNPADIYGNASLGYWALNSCNSAKNCTAIGRSALYPMTDGNDNIGIGADAGADTNDAEHTENTSSNQCIFIGCDTIASSYNDTNSIVIGHNAYGAGSNTAVIGNDSIANIYLKGSLHSNSGRIVKTTHIVADEDTTSYTPLSTDHHIFVNIDTSSISINLPPGIEGTEYYIYSNQGDHNISVFPDSTQLLFGDNAGWGIDGYEMHIVYNEDEGWLGHGQLAIV